MSAASSPLEHFSGTARLFPLPNLVLFPQVIQPLHIFEPRYRQMTADALADDRLLAMALLKPGWEADYACSPPLYPVACLGKIVAEQLLPDGRYHLLLRGVSRIRIDHELPTSKLYRLARVELIADIGLDDPSAGRALRKQLIRRISAWFPGQDAVLAQFRKLWRGDLALGALCDILAFALPLDAGFKQELLEEADAEKRARHLIHHLETNEPPQAVLGKDRKFPPDFSCN